MLESGQTIAGYEIVKPLTENPLFSSYLVADSSGGTAQLLLLDEGQLQDKKARQAFIAQAQLLCGQSFPGLCSLIAADANDEYSYCLYPVAAGVPLTARLSEHFTVRDSLQILRGLASCLSPAHSSGLFHGSISPATIYFEDEAVSLDQFALSSLLKLDFHSGIDPCYSSPELVRGEQSSAASDLYSLGIILYRLLTGKVPFSADDPFSTAMLHVQEQAPPLVGTLSLLQPLLDALLCTLPAERWSAERLVSEIDQFLQLPELEKLTMAQEAPEQKVQNPEPEDDQPTKIEQAVEQSDMAQRIEKRLKERAEILQQSGELSSDAKRASTARMSAIGQQSYRKSQEMNRNTHQKKNKSNNFVLLTALGVAVGVVIYLLLLQPNSSPQSEALSMPLALQAGLEKGSRALEQDNLVAAEETFMQLTKEFPLVPQPYNNLAAIYAKKGDLEQSKTLLERAMATDSLYVTVYRNLGTVYSEMARDSYGRALQLEKGQQAVTLQVFGGADMLAINTAALKEEPIEVVQSAVVTTKPALPETRVAMAPAIASGETSVAEEVPLIARVEEVDQQAEIPPVKELIVESEKESSENVVADLPDPESAQQFLQRWARAWSSQDIAAYLDFYAAEFTPSAGISREEWTNQRKTRIARPKSIEVSLQDFTLVRQSDEKMQLEVTQNYQSDRYADSTRKSFDLLYDGADWQIIRERSLGRVR